MFHPLAYDEFECIDCGAVLADALDVDADGRCLTCHTRHHDAERFWRRYREANERKHRNERTAAAAPVAVQPVEPQEFDEELARDFALWESARAEEQARYADSFTDDPEFRRGYASGRPAHLLEYEAEDAA